MRSVQQTERRTRAVEAQTRDMRAYVRAVHAYLQGHDAAAARIARRLAHRPGMPDAQYLLGLLYLRGRGVERDQAVGLAWIERAAAGGSALAEAELASRYFSGNGVPRDPHLARGWARKAGTHGQLRGQRVLCALDFRAHRTPGARHWCGKAARRGDALSQFFLARLLQDTGPQQARRHARNWMQRAAKQGWLPAQTKLGDYYHDGVGGSRNDRRALYWWRRAAGRGNARAQVALARAYANGWGIKRDPLSAYVWLCRARAQGIDDHRLRHRLRRDLSAGQRRRAAHLARSIGNQRGAAPTSDQ